MTKPSASVLHRAAGLVIAAGRPLPGFLPSGASATRADLHIHLEKAPAWTAAPLTPLHAAGHTDDAGRPVVVVARSTEGFHFTYADGTRAWIDARGEHVWCTWPASASLDDTCTYLYGPILGLVLRLRGALAFHASAVQIGAGAFAFAGPHGAGKSTLAAALGSAGHPVITDDVLHVRHDGSRWLAEPFASMLKLWPEGARLALGEGADLPCIAEGWNKRALRLDGGVPAAAHAVPLAAIACLQDAAARPAIDPLSAGSALLRLAANSSASHLLDGRQRAAEFLQLSAIVADVPCVTITPPGDPKEYGRFVAGVLRWAQAQDLAH